MAAFIASATAKSNWASFLMMALSIIGTILWVLPVVMGQAIPQLSDIAPEPSGENSANSSYADYASELVLKGLMGQLPVVPADPTKIQEKAQQVMGKRGYDFITGAAGEGATKEANRLAFRQWRIIPRFMQPTTPRNLSVNLFGHTYSK